MANKLRLTAHGMAVPLHEAPHCLTVDVLAEVVRPVARPNLKAALVVQMVSARNAVVVFVVKVIKLVLCVWSMYVRGFVCSSPTPSNLSVNLHEILYGCV